MFCLILYQMVVFSMLKLYYLLFQILLVFPVFGLLNSAFVNKFPKIQRIINNCVYIILSALCATVLIFFTEYGRYDVYLFTMARHVPLAFSANSLNLMFGFFMSVFIIFLNMVFQNSFGYLNLADKYKLYNKQMASLYFLCMLLSFSHSILLTVFLYVSIIMASYFLITNPDLKEFRKKYSIVFSTSLIVSIIFMCMLGFYYKYTGNTFFSLQNVSKLKSVSGYWLVFVFILLIASNFCAPIYFIFKEKLYYEDLLPVFTILTIPFIFCTTFLFIKTAYFVFYNSLTEVEIYFLFTNVFVFLLFILSCVFTIKYIKNNIKFIILYCFSCFIVFLSQMLFINTSGELVNVFATFLLLMLSLCLSVLSYSGILFLLLKLGITDTNILYKSSRIELNFHVFCLLVPILILLVSFFDLDLQKFYTMYFINLIEIFSLFGIYIAYIVFTINKQVKNTEKVSFNDNKERIKFFAPQVALFVFIVFFLLLKSQIARFVLYYK